MLAARVAVLVAVSASTSPGPDGVGAIQFEDRQASSGIDFVLDNATTPDKPIIDSMLGGVAVLDYDGDGRLDVFFTDGARIPGLVKDGPRFWNRLYRNEGGGRFRAVTERTGVRGHGYSMGASAGDYNGDGAADGGDIQWIGQNGTSRVQINVESPMFYDDNWMGNLNYTINNLSGPLPFTPKWEVKVSGSYTIPKIEVDFGARLRFHTGRPMWQLESYPEHTQWADPPGGIINPGGLAQIVNDDPANPWYLPALTILDLHLEKAIGLGKSQKLNLVVDGFNVFNTNTPTNIDTQWEFGKVTSIPQSRRFRAGIRYQF